MSVFFGGECWPLGSTVGFLELPYAEAVEATVASRDVDKVRARALPAMTLRDRVMELAPLQTPSKRELLVPVGDRWTAHLRNCHLGGDSFMWVMKLSGTHRCRGVLAGHHPATQYPLPSTQFHLFGPDGQPPLRYVRTIDAGIFDSGRWRFDTSGEPLAFEELDAYDQRLKRNRFTRPMLIRYLAALGIDADREAAFGDAGTVIHDLGDWQPRTTTIDHFRADHATAP